MKDDKCVVGGCVDGYSHALTGKSVAALLVRVITQQVLVDQSCDAKVDRELVLAVAVADYAKTTHPTKLNLEPQGCVLPSFSPTSTISTLELQTLQRTTLTSQILNLAVYSKPHNSRQTSL
jgi:hypothetical protein